MPDRGDVERYAARLLDGCPAAEAAADLDARIAAHDNVDGYCANGWRLAYPCPTRRFYEAVRQHLGAPGSHTPEQSISEVSA